MNKIESCLKKIPQSPRAKEWQARLFLLFLPLGFFWRETLGRVTLGDQDAVFWFFPAYQFAADQIRTGSFPFWNPNQYGGIPFFSEWQSGVLDPLNWIHWLGVTSRSLTLSLELSFAIALLAMFSYARSIGFTRRASIFAAIIFGLSGFLVGRTLYPGFVRIVALMPLVLCFTERLSQRGRWRDVVFGALIIAWQIFAAHPQPLIYSSLLAYAYALFKLRIADCGLRISLATNNLSGEETSNRNFQINGFGKTEIRNRLSFLLKFSLMFIAAISLAAVQLFPAFEFATKSVRQEWPFELFTLHSLHPASLLVTLFPFFHGSGKTIYSLPYWGTYWHHNEAQIYLGALALSLAMAGAIAAWRFRYGIGKFWSIVSIVGTVLAMGKYSGSVARLLFHFPLLSHFRSPNRHWMEVALAIAVLAGYAVDRLIRAEAESGYLRRCLQITSATIALLVLAIGATALWQKQAFENWLRSLPDLNHLPFGFMQSATWEFLLPMIVAVCVCVALVFFARTQKRWAFALLFACLLIDFNLYAQFAPINNPAKLETLIGRAMPPELAAEQNPLQPFRYQMMLNAATGEFSPYWFYGHEMMAGYDPVLTERQKVFSGLDEAGRSFNMTMLEPQDRTLDIFNVRYVFVPPGTKTDSLVNDQSRWREVTIKRDLSKPYADYRIFENLRALPRVWLAGKTKTAWEGDQLKLIRGQIIDPQFDPRTTALIDPNTAAKVTLPPEGGANNLASIIRRSPTELVVESNADKTSLLVMSEMAYPGWQVKVDGVESELLRVNYNLHAVQVAAGKHIVELSYWPDSLTKGAIITLMTALLLVGVLLWERRRFKDAGAESVSV